MTAQTMTTMNKTHNGTLKGASFSHLGGGNFWVEGRIFGHPNFPDGNYIHTSQIVSVRGTEIETLNSFYTVEWNPDFPVNF